MIDLDVLLSSKEKITLEVKKAAGGLPKSTWETYSSFANTRGGTALLGVEEVDFNLKVVGISNPDQMVKDIWNTLHNPQKVSSNILYDEHVYSMEYEGKTIVLIEVPRANRQDKPVYVGTDMFQGSFRRNGDGDYHCRPEEVLAMVRDKVDESIDGKVLENLLLTDLNGDSIRHYRTMFRNTKPNHVWNNLSDEQFLVKIGAAQKGSDNTIHPTLAGFLFLVISLRLPMKCLISSWIIGNAWRLTPAGLTGFVSVMPTGAGICLTFTSESLIKWQLMWKSHLSSTAIWQESGFKRPELVECLDPDRVTLTLQIETAAQDDVNDVNSDGKLQ